MVEALVALSVVAVVLAAIGSLVSTTLKGGRAVQERVTLIETARLMATLLHARRSGPDADSGTTAGMRWDMRSVDLEGQETATGAPWAPRHVIVRIRSPSGATVQIETVRLQKRQGP